MEHGSIIDTLVDFLQNQNIKADPELLSASLRELNFTQTLSLIDKLKYRLLKLIKPIQNY